MVINHYYLNNLNCYCSVGKYYLDFKYKSDSKDKTLSISTEALIELYKEFIKEFLIISIKDLFDQDHWKAWTTLTAYTNIQVHIFVNCNFIKLVIYIIQRIRSQFYIIFKRSFI